MNQKPALVVLAAGMGSRYGGLKQMDPMGPNGETVLDYSVYDAIRAGFSKIIFVIREDFAQAFRQTIGTRFADQIQITYTYQKLDDLPSPHTVPTGRTKPWGTAHAIRAARTEIDRPFAVINADDFYGADAYQQAAAYLTSESPSAYCLVGYRITNTLSEHGSVNRGICLSENSKLQSVTEVVEIHRSENGRITGIDENGITVHIPEQSIASMNLWGFPASFINELEDHFTTFLEKHGTEETSECYIPTVIDTLIHTGKHSCHILETSSSWFGVTYPEDKPHVVANILRLIKSGEYPEKLY